jgi:decaprenylphospho-beta-D-ribofuranose 2-oxidase
VEAKSKILSGKQHFVTNWSMTEQSPCYVFKAQDIAEIMHALTTARALGLPVIAHGTGHSYTDAALNTNGVIIDVTGMRSIHSWDPVQGIMQVEPGVTLRDMVRVSLADRWWPPVTPSTAEATIGGCVAMNVNGKNAWKCGTFGEHLLSLSVLLATGQMLTLSPENNPQLFKALVGSAGLLGIITSITLQLQRIPSGSVDVLVRSTASLSEIFTIFQEEQSADFLEAWVDGFAGGHKIGRGIVTSTRYSEASEKEFPAITSGTKQSQISRRPDQFKMECIRGAGKIGRPAVTSTAHIANSLTYQLSKWWDRRVIRQQSLFRSTYYNPLAYSVYRTLLTGGTETFQAFVPRYQAETLFKEIMLRSQKNDFIPLWCIIKQHRKDPFLLSYQVDGFSLEVNYHIVPKTLQKLHKMLRELMDLVISAGGRFYLAKDSLLTNSLYRRSVGDAIVEEFLHLKKRYDPDMLFQSNLFRRVFQASLQEMEPRSLVDFGERASRSK